MVGARRRIGSTTARAAIASGGTVAMKRVRTLALAVGFSLLGATAVAAPGAAPAAGSPAGGNQAKPENKPSTVQVDRRGGHTVYRLTEGIVIEGKVQKPTAFYLLPRSAMNYSWETMKQDFVPRIRESTRRSPF
jgi:hypothetical protein